MEYMLVKFPTITTTIRIYCRYLSDKGLCAISTAEKKPLHATRKLHARDRNISCLVRYTTLDPIREHGTITKSHCLDSLSVLRFEFNQIILEDEATVVKKDKQQLPIFQPNCAGNATENTSASKCRNTVNNEDFNIVLPKAAISVMFSDAPSTWSFPVQQHLSWQARKSILAPPDREHNDQRCS
eukprot:scpid79774/ scgid12594/ 